MNDFLAYVFRAATSLFVIVDPLAIIPAFLAMTARNSADDRVRMARLACWVGAGVLAIFVVVGPFLFKFLGITLSAFKIAGSIVLLLIALDMLRAKTSPVRSSVEETDEGSNKDDIAITPLAVPMLAGPGAISTVILLQSQAKTWYYSVALLVIVCAVFCASYFILRFAATHGTRFLSPIALRIITRIMGLLLASVAVQFALDGIAEQRQLFTPSR